MRASTRLTASRASMHGGGSRVALTLPMPLPNSLRCRRTHQAIAFTAASSPAALRPTARPCLVPARASPSNESSQDDAVLKSIVEAAAAAAKAARESSSSSTSSSVASGVSSTSSASSSSDEATSSSGLRGATVSPRRTRMITFTCNKCDSRTERQINPTAWDKGLVFVQCGNCQTWHKVADAAGLIEEVVFEEGEPAALVKSDSTSSPELSFEAAGEPHGLVAIQGDADDRKEYKL